MKLRVAAGANYRTWKRSWSPDPADPADPADPYPYLSYGDSNEKCSFLHSLHVVARQRRQSIQRDGARPPVDLLLILSSSPDCLIPFNWSSRPPHLIVSFPSTGPHALLT
ncbi:hypothetical protein EYF80_045804 [Liparis tanakae]|uniref:Uncharacterized protein n=1 Tax=Liparis tanakae TaxID=230148 RepID=A0A4Z2FT09_9TELE|nr:hypothetical protein EYF80_045804 [Liparis tanakae]